MDPVRASTQPRRENPGEITRVGCGVEARRAAGQLDDVDRGIVARRDRVHDSSDGRAPGDPDRLAGPEKTVDDLAREAGEVCTGRVAFAGGDDADLEPESLLDRYGEGQIPVRRVPELDP